MQELEAREGRLVEDIIRELYDEQGLTLEQAATRLGITKSALSRWMLQLGLPARRAGPRRRVVVI